MSSTILKIDDLRKHFPVVTQMPELLVRLLEWRNEWYKSHPNENLRDYLGFDLYDCKDALALWFGEESEYDTSQFAVFAHDVEGSLFAYWFGEERDIDTAPIVLLHAEGIPDSHVIANSLEDLLKLLTPTEKELAILSKSGDKQIETLMSFRNWLRESCGIELPRTDKSISTIEKRARESDTSFQSWLFSG